MILGEIAADEDDFAVGADEHQIRALALKVGNQQHVSAGHDEAVAGAAIENGAIGCRRARSGAKRRDLGCDPAHGFRPFTPQHSTTVLDSGL